VASKKRRIRSPDGREWEVLSYRLRLPRWRQADYEPWDDVRGIISGIIVFLLVVPFVLVVLPLLVFLLELPLAVAWSLFTSERWVEAVCRWPSEIRITWRTTSADAENVVDEVARQLELGYGEVNPEHADLLEMTRPPGFEDVDR
jgi:hypothetical protein